MLLLLSPAKKLDYDTPVRTTLHTQPLFVDDYAHNRATGRFILVDEATNATVAAGMITAPS